MYHSKAFEEVVKATNADAVALDFYSRYSRPTGIPCERFQVRSTAVATSIVSHFLESYESRIWFAFTALSGAGVL